MDTNNGAATTAAEKAITRRVRTAEWLTFLSREDREAYVKSLPNKKGLIVRRNCTKAWNNNEKTFVKRWEVYISSHWI